MFPSIIQIGDWDVSSVPDFSKLLVTDAYAPIPGAAAFNEPIKWNTGMLNNNRTERGLLAPSKPTYTLNLNIVQDLLQICISCCMAQQRSINRYLLILLRLQL